MNISDVDLSALQFKIEKLINGSILPKKCIEEQKIKFETT